MTTYHEILQQVSHNFEGWDESLETGLLILSKNQMLLEQLQKTPLSVAQEDAPAVRGLLENIQQKTQQIQQLILHEKTKVTLEMGQLNQQEKKLKNYFYSQNQSQYVDRDF